MKALTLHAPWAWAICFLGKRVENRTWAPPSGMIGKRFAIHAGSARMWTLAELIPVLNLWHTIHRGEQYDQRFPPAEDFCSAIVATARLVGVEPPLPGPSRMIGWRVSDQFGWMLDDIQVLETPVKCRGFQSLWTVPEELERRIVR